MGTQLNRIITNETGDTKLKTTSTREDTIKIKQEDTHTETQTRTREPETRTGTD